MGSWIRFGIVAVVAALAIVRVAVSRDFSWVGLFLGLGGTVILLLVVSALSHIRISVLRRRYPDSFLAQLQIYSELSSQLETLNDALANDAKYVGPLRYATLVVDRDEVRLFGGVRAPKLLFAMPTEALVDSRILKAQQGKYNWASFRLVFSAHGELFPLDFSLVSFDWLISRPLREKALADRLADVRAVIGMKP